MEERHISQKSRKGYISTAAVQRTGEGWIAMFVEGDKKIRYSLTKQRGEDRVFKTLDAAESALKRMGIKQFLVISEK